MTQVLLEPDIVVITPDVFYSLRTNIDSTNDADLCKKVSDLIGEYSCFQNEIPQTKSNHRFGHKNNYSTHPNKHNKNIHRVYKQIPFNDRVNREFNSLLNKVNKANFNCIIEKMVRLCQATNISSLLDLVIKKTYKQEAFMDTYIQVIQYLSKNYESEIKTALQFFYEKFNNELENNLGKLNTFNYNEYNDFCSFLVSKNEVLAKNRVLLTIASKGMIIIDIKDHFALLMNMYEKFMSNILISDVVILLLSDFFKHNHNNLFLNIIKDREFEGDFDHVSTKSKFLLRDILENNKLKMKN